MEKLIELLNEYEIEREEKIDLFKDKEKPLWEWYKDCTGDLTFEPIDSKILNGEAFSGDTGYSVIISKSYGFIGWLVDNDKIDYEKIGTKIGMEYHKAYFPINKYWYVYDMETGSISSAEYSDYESLLMLLSISSSPIEDLISYLR